jgi:hypothetical protein
MSLVQAVTAYTLRRHLLPPDWEITDLLSPPGSSLGYGGGGSSGHPIPPQSSAKRGGGGGAAAGGSPFAAGGGGGGGPHSLAHAATAGAAAGGGGGGAASASGSIPASWSLGLEVGDSELPPLEPTLLSGQAISPSTVSLLGLAGGGYSSTAADLNSRREVSDRLFNCLLGHLYNLARGELLRLGAALGIAALSAAQATAVLQLGRAAFAAPPGDSGGKGSGAAASAAAGGGNDPAVAALVRAAGSGSLNPVWVAHLQELMAMPLCGFSQMITKFADGTGGAAYEIITPKFTPAAEGAGAALQRAESEGGASAAAGGGGGGPSGAAAGVGGNPNSGGSLTGVFNRLRGSGGSGNIPGSPAHPHHHTTASSGSGSRLAVGDAAAAGSGGAEGGGGNFTRGRPDDPRLEDLEEVSCSDPSDVLSPVNIGTPLSDARMGGDDDATSSPRHGDSSDTRVTGTHGLAALDLASRPAGNLRVHSAYNAAASTSEGGSSGGAAAGGGPAAAHGRSVSALPAGAGGPGGALPSPRMVEGAIDLPGSSAALAAAAAAAGGGSGGSAAAAGSGSSGATVATAAGGDRKSSAGGGGIRTFAPSSLTPSQMGGSSATAGGLPARVGEWRLAAALQGPAPFGSLVMELSQLTAWCYAKAGRVRSSALVYADVATLQLQHGQLQHACRWVLCVGLVWSSGKAESEN